MDKNHILKLTLIDIFPSLEEIEEQNNKEEISIIFQGLNIFYNLKDLLINKKDIYLNHQIQKNTLLISLVQSVNILANGLLSIKSGKQWVTFSYENKKKNPSSNLALNLMDCIKINISCLIISKNTDNYIRINTNYNHKTFNKKRETKKNLAHKNSKNLISKKNINNDNKIINNKHKHNNSQEHNLINSYNFGRDSLYSTENEAKYIFKSKKDYHFIKNMNSFSTMGKNNKKFELNSSLSLSSNKLGYNMPNIEPNKMYSTIRQKINSNNNKPNNSLFDNQTNNIHDFEIEPKIEVKEEHNYIKKNKTNNQIKLNIVHKKQKSCNTLNIVENRRSMRYKTSEEKYRLKQNNDSSKKIAINNTVIRKKSKNNIISNNNYPLNIDRNYLYNISSVNTKSNFKKSELLASFQKENNVNNNIKNTFITEKKSFKNINNLNINNINNTSLFNNNNDINPIINNSISDKNFEKNQTIENFENSSMENDNYNKLKEDILLLYNNDYVINIKEDLLKLEIELFVEKMTELTNEYHIQLYDKLLEYQIEKNKYNINLLKYAQLNKLYNKLKSIRENKEIKNKNLNENDKIIKKENNNIFKVNKYEIDIYKLLFNNKNNSNNIIENKIKLKKILNIILKKHNIEKTINYNKKNYQKIINYLNISKTIENNQIRSRIIPKNQQTKFNYNQINLTNSYILENSNEKYDNKLNDIYVKTNIFSPLVRTKNNIHNTINRIKKNFE